MGSTAFKCSAHMYEFKEVRCAICDRDQVKVLGIRASLSFSGKEARVVRCVNCGLMYAHPMPFPDEGQIQENFGDPSSYFTCSRDERLDLHQRILQGIERFSHGRGRFLDVGCGRGELVHVAQRSGWDAAGVDISEAFVRYAREKYGIDARAGKLEEMRFPAESFDAVSMVSVLQCSHHPKELLQEINRILKKGGILFIETTNCNGLLFILGDLFYRMTGQRKTTRLSPLSPAYEVYGFSPGTLREILLRTGYEVLDIQATGSMSGGQGFKATDVKTTVLFYLRYGVVLLGIAIGMGQVLNAWARKT